MQYVKAKLEEKQEDMIYRVYVTDALKAISSQNTMLKTRFFDLLFDDVGKPQQKTSAEIKKEIFDVFKKLSGGEN